MVLLVIKWVQRIDCGVSSMHDVFPQRILLYKTIRQIVEGSNDFVGQIHGVCVA